MGFAHEQLCRVVGLDGDPAALGGAVTVALCGHWEHEGDCRWPHRAETVVHGGEVVATVGFDAPAEDVDGIRSTITEVLSAGTLVGPDGRRTSWGTPAGGVTAEPPRERDLDRFLTFVDAVVAIAITLLVLPLAESATEIGEGSVGELIRESETQLVGFLLSFLVIAQLWFAQHRIVSGLVVQDTLVTRLMLAWTLTIVLLPFPTALVAEAGDDPATKVFYIGIMAISSALLALVAWAIGRDRALRDTDRRPDPAPAAGAALGFVLALAITLTFPGTGYYPLFLLLLTGPAVSTWRRARGGRKYAGDMGE